MSTIYYVKAYYTKQQQAGNQPEIRRFAIDISPENDIYRELCTKVATFQPDIQLNGFILQYVDEENERITFSSTDELRSAIETNKDNAALKIFVTPNQPAAPQQQQQQETTSNKNKECHVGVECDGCKGPVDGIRYKCFVCPNYDLCEKCSQAGVHSEHNMIKIIKPGNHFHPYGPRHHGGSGRRHRHMPPPPFVPNPQFMEQLNAQIPQWLPNGQNTEHFRNHMQQHFESFKNHGQTHLRNSKQYLESVGQYLQQALSPFGIDCDYHVGEQTSRQEPTSNEQQPMNEEAPKEEEVPAAAAAAAAAPTPEPSAVPKYPDLSNENQDQPTASASASSNSQEKGGISSLLNMLRVGGTNSPTSAAPSTASSIRKPSDTAVEECIEKMKAMGFNDTNGALLELIRSKQGDINQVLDAINPRHHQA